jgi:hypothetical protein
MLDHVIRSIIWIPVGLTLQGLLRDIGGSSVAAFDNTGAVFAVACSQTQTIALYAHATMDHVRPLSIADSQADR